MYKCVRRHACAHWTVRLSLRVLQGVSHIKSVNWTYYMAYSNLYHSICEESSGHIKSQEDILYVKWT